MALYERVKRRAVAGRRAGDEVRIRRRTETDVHCHKYDAIGVGTVDRCAVAAEAGGWRLEAGGWRLEAGGWRLVSGRLGAF
jgi:hypothetical protein